MCLDQIDSTDSERLAEGVLDVACCRLFSDILTNDFMQEFQPNIDDVFVYLRKIVHTPSFYN